MADGSGIEWTDATWNPVAGCTPASAGCLNCYAARMALRLSHMPGKTGAKYGGTAEKTKSGRPAFTGKISLDYDALDTPRKWRLPRTIFVNSMSDLFHPEVPLDFIQRCFEVMSECPQHIFQVLTKRPERARELARELVSPWPANVWMGTSVEDQRVVWRVRELQRIPAPTRFLSCEPLIGPLRRLPLKGISWVIVGGESGPKSRPMEAGWVDDIRNQCLEKSVHFFFKQWGGVNKKATGRELEGRTWDDMPARDNEPDPCLMTA